MTDTSSSAAARGRTLLDLGRAAEAEREIRNGLAGSPQDHELHIDLARSLLMQERAPEALEASANAVALAPSDPRALWIHSVVQTEVGHLPGARTSIDSALRIAPEVGVLHAQLGRILHQQDRPAEALESFRKARSLDPEDADFAAATAAALHDLGRNDEATTAVAEALALDPNNAPAHHVRSLIAMRSGSSRDALDSGRSAVRLDPTNENRRELLAVTMKARNPLYRAMWRYSDWLDRMPSNYKWIALFAPLVLIRVLRNAGDSLAVQVLIGVVIAFVAISWLIEPLMNSVLMASSFGRGLLPTPAKRATYAFLGFALAAVGCAIAGLTTDLGDLLLVAMACVVWAASSGMLHGLSDGQQRIGWGLAGAAGALALVVIAGTVAGASFAWALALLLLVAGVASMWFVSIAGNRN